MHVMSPWDSPWKGQDNLSQLPPEITEDEVMTRLEETDTIAISCTDKDMVHDVWEMKRMGGTRNVWLLAIAGGVIQPEGERYEAMQTIAQFLYEQASSGKMPRLGCVTILSHNEICGAVKRWNGGECITDLVKRVVGKEAQRRDFEENSVMTALIRHGAMVWEPFKQINGVMVNMGLHDLQRDGQGNKPQFKPLTMDGPTLTVGELKDEEKINKILC